MARYAAAMTLEPTPAPLPVDVISSPDLLDWLTAIGTVGAVVVALLVAGIDYFRHRDEKRQAQAALVNAWITVDFEDGDPRRNLVGMYKAHNASNAPVFDFVAHLPQEYSHHEGGTYRSPILLVPTQEAVNMDGQYDDLPMVKLQGDTAIEITFRDAAGHWWRRGTDGVLQHLRRKPTYDE